METPDIHLSTKFGDVECMICSEPATVIFRPCGDKITCEPCSIRMKKCLNCQQPITKKETTGIKGREGREWEGM